MGTHVDFEFSRDYGKYKKGDVKKFYKPLALDLQKVEKAGKIINDKVEPGNLAGGYVDFKFSEDYGKYKKDQVKRFYLSLATDLQNTEKAGKIVIPNRDKTDKKVGTRATK